MRKRNKAVKISDIRRFLKMYSQRGKEIGELVERKNKAYGDSFAKSSDILRILYPNGIGTDQYDDVLAITRIIDKLFRIATDRDALGENPWQDICGYSLLRYVQIGKKDD